MRIELGPQSTWTCSAFHHSLSMFIESETSAVDPFQSPNFCGERLLHEQYNKGPVSYLRRYRKPWAFTGVTSSITCCKVTLASIESMGLLGNHLADIMAIFSPSAKPIVAFFLETDNHACMNRETTVAIMCRLMQRNKVWTEAIWESP